MTIFTYRLALSGAKSGPWNTLFDWRMEDLSVLVLSTLPRAIETFQITVFFHSAQRYLQYIYDERQSEACIIPCYFVPEITLEI